MCGAAHPPKSVLLGGFLTTYNPREERKRAWPIRTELGVPFSSPGLLAAWLCQVHGRFHCGPPQDSPQGLAEPGMGSPTGRCLCPTPCPERGINNCERPAHRADGSDEVIWDLNKCERRWLPADSFYLAT